MADTEDALYHLSVTAQEAGGPFILAVLPGTLPLFLSSAFLPSCENTAQSIMILTFSLYHRVLLQNLGLGGTTL